MGLDAGKRGEGGVSERRGPLRPDLSQSRKSGGGRVTRPLLTQANPKSTRVRRGPSSVCRTGDPTPARPLQDDAGPRDYKGHVAPWHETSQPGTGPALAPPSLILCPMTPRHLSQQLEGPLRGEGWANSWALSLRGWWQGAERSSRGGQKALLPRRCVPFMSPKEALKSQTWEVWITAPEHPQCHQGREAEMRERKDTCDLSGM